MSRAYRIQVKESTTQDISGSDEICTRLEILEILPPEDLAELLREELRKNGYEEKADGMLVKTKGTVHVTVDPCSGEVRVNAVSEKKLTIETVRDGVVIDDVGAKPEEAKRKLQEQAREDLTRRVKREEEKLQEKATAELERQLDELQPELGAIVNKVTREALKSKAKQMGTITGLSEDEKTGELTIVVEL